MRTRLYYLKIYTNNEYIPYNICVYVRYTRRRIIGKKKDFDATPKGRKRVYKRVYYMVIVSGRRGGYLARQTRSLQRGVSLRHSVIIIIISRVYLMRLHIR